VRAELLLGGQVEDLELAASWRVSVLPAKNPPLSAMIFSLGCMMAESAVTVARQHLVAPQQPTWPPHDVVGVCEVNNDNLVGVVDILAAI
jgi:hypothetical protein